MRVQLTCKGRRRVCRRGDGVETGTELTFRRPDGATSLECPIEEMAVTYSGPAGLRLAMLFEDGQSYPWTCEDAPALSATTDEPPATLPAPRPAMTCAAKFDTPETIGRTEPKVCSRPWGHAGVHRDEFVSVEEPSALPRMRKVLALEVRDEQGNVGHILADASDLAGRR